MLSGLVVLLLLNGCRLTICSYSPLPRSAHSQLVNAINEMSDEILALRVETNHRSNHKPQEVCLKKIMAFVPQRFQIKNKELFGNFEKMKRLLGDLSKQMTILDAYEKEINIVGQFHQIIEFAIKVMKEDVEVLSKRRLSGLANMCYMYAKIRNKSDAKVDGEEDVKKLKEKMEEVEIDLLYEKMHDVKADRARLQKLCADQLKNATDMIKNTFTPEGKNSTVAGTEEAIKELEVEVMNAHSDMERKKSELLDKPQEFEKLKKQLQMQAFVLDHYTKDIDCFKSLKSSTMKIKKPSFGHLLPFMND